MSENRETSPLKRKTAKRAAAKSAKKAPRKSPPPARPSTNPLMVLLVMGGVAAIAFLGVTVIRQQRAIRDLQSAVHNDAPQGDSAKGKAPAKEKKPDHSAEKDQSDLKQKGADAPESGESEFAGSLFLLRYDESRDVVQYVPVRRKFSEPTLSAALDALIAGPDADERSRGLLSTIPDNLKVRSIVVRGDTATIDLSSHLLADAFGDIAVNRINQLFMTATQFPSVSRVVILVEGRPLSEIDGRVIEWPMKRRL